MKCEGWERKKYKYWMDVGNNYICPRELLKMSIKFLKFDYNNKLFINITIIFYQNYWHVNFKGMMSVVCLMSIVWKVNPLALHNQYKIMKN